MGNKTTNWFIPKCIVFGLLSFFIASFIIGSSHIKFCGFEKSVTLFSLTLLIYLFFFYLIASLDKFAKEGYFGK